MSVVMIIPSIRVSGILQVDMRRAFPSGLDDKKNLPAMQKTGFNPWAGKIVWRREWQPTPVFLPGEFHGQRSLAGYSP